MNKTVNINLANMLFHIDENAYMKLRRYLEAIKRSFAGTKGSDEIIADIEARIAELFYEKMEDARQVITQKEVDEVIAIMGQPEDYQIDEDIFDDGPAAGPGPTTARSTKKLYRDIDHKYIGGVCAGLEHYLGLDALWIRLIFILLGVFTGFGFIAYILLWILVPEAATTAQKLDMTGQPVNISNIERKVKEGFDDVAERVRNVDYEKVGNKVKSGGKSFFDTLGDIIMFFFKVIGKFIGILLIIIGAATLIGLFVALFTVGVVDSIHIPGVDIMAMLNSTGTPVWVVSLLIFLLIGIPFFFLLYLGLKILVNNLKSIGNIAKFSLLGLWLIAVITLSVLSVKQAAAHAYTGSVTERDSLALALPADTLRIRFREDDRAMDNGPSIGRMRIRYGDNGRAMLYSSNLLLDVRMAEDSVSYLRIRKDADGSSYDDARERAGNINYNYALAGNTLTLDNFFTTATENKVRDQVMRLTLYVPAGTHLAFDESGRNYIGRRTQTDRDLYRKDIVRYTWRMEEDGRLVCLDCPPETSSSGDWEEGDGEGHIIIDENGVDIDLKDREDSFQMKIDEDGVKIKANEGGMP